MTQAPAQVGAPADGRDLRRRGLAGQAGAAATGLGDPLSLAGNLSTFSGPWNRRGSCIFRSSFLVFEKQIGRFLS
jgi:hypothetical protein